MFCQLESIRRYVKLSALRKAPASLPKSLDEIYKLILQNLDSVAQLNDTLKALQRLCFSYRPLGLLEMREVLAIGIGEGGGFDPDERLVDPSNITVICSSLISFQFVSSDNLANDTNLNHDVASIDLAQAGSNVQVQLAHSSVKEYLLAGRFHYCSTYQSPLYHAVISEGCLHYLLYLTQVAPLRRDVFDGPLVEYA